MPAERGPSGTGHDTAGRDSGIRPLGKAVIRRLFARRHESRYLREMARSSIHNARMMRDWRRSVARCDTHEKFRPEPADPVWVSFDCGHRAFIDRAEYGDGSAFCGGCGEIQVYARCLTCGSLECHTGEMIPSSDLPGALLHLCEENAEEREEWRSDWEALRAEAKALEVAGERDRRQIARLTEALRFYADPVSYENETPRHVRPVITDQGARARAVLADEEDAP